ncbi:nicotinate-nucleotide pyrophosphorylase [Methanococcoides sp. FTZ1]|uniref:nicotinate-nucleotide pyrophosphorylase n=1 Tax=Methanococcoides sp. FTZ1 TaxID=3439061 RepID=UPI003F836495
MIEAFEQYLLEDCPYGDETTELLKIEGEGTLKIMSRDAGIASCADELAEFYRKKGLKVTSYLKDGDRFEENSILFEAEGDLRTIFKLWRISQTFLSMTCAIATKTKMISDAAKAVNPDVIIATSRKTHPGFRKYELKAVRAGGGDHHRNSLSDSVLITQNHFNVVGSFGKLNSMRKIEIEPKTKEEVFEYAPIADILLLDHYTPEELKEIAPELRRINPKLEIAVGGIEFKDIPKYAEAVDIVVTTAPYYAKPFDLTTMIDRI